MRKHGLLLVAAVAAKKIGHGPLREDEYPAARWMSTHTAGASEEMVPMAARVAFTRGERCVLAHEGVTLRRAAELAKEDGCLAGDEATTLYRRRCAVHRQPHAHCLETTTDAQRRFWHAHDNHAGSSSAGEAMGRLASRGIGDLYLWGDAATMADAHHLFCELLRARWAVEEKDAGAFAAELANGTVPTLQPYERLPFKSFKACQRTGRCLRVHAMRLFGVARFGGLTNVLDAALKSTPTADARVAHVLNDGLMSWPALISTVKSPDPAHDMNDAQAGADAYVRSVATLLDTITRWRRALPDPERVLLAWRETYPQHFVTGDGSGLARARLRRTVSGLGAVPDLACAPNVTGGGYAALERRIRERSKAGVPVVETFDLYKDRGDLHLGPRGGFEADCTSYCYAPHLVGPLFDRAAAALLRPPSGRKKSGA
jgi:hypothetical protein